MHFDHHKMEVISSYSLNLRWCIRDPFLKNWNPQPLVTWLSWAYMTTCSHSRAGFVDTAMFFFYDRLEVYRFWSTSDVCEYWSTFYNPARQKVQKSRLWAYFYHLMICVLVVKVIWHTWDSGAWMHFVCGFLDSLNMFQLEWADECCSTCVLNLCYWLVMFMTGYTPSPFLSHFAHTPFLLTLKECTTSC